MEENLEQKIEALLFTAGRPVKNQELVQTLQVSSEQVQAAVETLKRKINTGLIVIEKDSKYQMVTAPEHSQVVADFLNAEVREKLTDAAVETLAIITYKQPISRAEIEAIRGVNSQYILRQLSIRGLVEKTTSTTDARRTVYRTTLEFLRHLGITKLNELPDFESLTRQVSLPEEPIEKAGQENENNQEHSTGT